MKRRIPSDNDASPLSADNYISRLKEATSAVKSESARLDNILKAIYIQASELLQTVKSVLSSEIYPPDEYNVANPDDYEWFLDDKVVPDDKTDEYYDVWETFFNAAHKYGQACDQLRVVEDLLDKLIE